MKMRHLFLFLFCLLLTIPCQARTITVNWDGSGDYLTIQAAINDSNDGDKIIVADGIYTGVGNRDIDFSGKAITVRSKNGPTNCIIDCQGDSNDPHRAFIFQSNEAPDSIVRGFTITGGYAEGRGGGILSVLSYECVCNPTIVNCIFANNRASVAGGGIQFSDFDITYHTKIINCTFSNNSAGSQGGAIDVWGKSRLPECAEIHNCIIWGNSAPQQPGIGITREAKISFYPTVAVDFGVLQSDWKASLYVVGENNIVADPCFADADANDYHLKSQAGRWDPNTETWVQDVVTSPAIDAGDPADPIGFEPFPNGGVINMGAYGGTAEASKSYFGTPPCETIVAGDINGDCTVNFLDFRLMALHWLEDNTP